MWNGAQNPKTGIAIVKGSKLLHNIENLLSIQKMVSLRKIKQVYSVAFHGKVKLNLL